MGVGITWNDKNLDYEIETQRKRVSVGGYPFLETTRTSITRLKHENDKNLDYEIETLIVAWFGAESNKRWLETTSTSITRLKLSIKQ